MPKDLKEGLQCSSNASEDAGSSTAQFALKPFSNLAVFSMELIWNLNTCTSLICQVGKKYRPNLDLAGSRMALHSRKEFRASRGAPAPLDSRL